MEDVLDYTFDHLHVYCSDVPATEKWFVEGLGAKLVGRREFKGVPAVDLRIGGVNLFLRGARPDEGFAAAGPISFGNDHFGLCVKGLEATIRELKSRGVEVVVEPNQINPKLKIAFVQGPDRVRIELVERTA